MSKVREHEYDDAMHDYMQWKDELKRLLDEKEPDEDAIFEAKEMIDKYEDALFGIGNESPYNNKNDLGESFEEDLESNLWLRCNLQFYCK